MKHIFEYLFSKKSDLDKLSTSYPYYPLRSYDIVRLKNGNYYMVFFDSDLDKIRITHAHPVNSLFLRDGGHVFLSSYDPKTLKYKHFHDDRWGIDAIYRPTIQIKIDDSRSLTDNYLSDLIKNSMLIQKFN